MMSEIKKVASPEAGAAKNQERINEMRMSVGNISSKGYAAPKTEGVKIRGTGAAIKGTMARGPMG